MAKNTQPTLTELNSLVDIASVYEQSEEKWHKSQVRKRGIIEKLIALIPTFLAITFIAWYLSGAPHTVGVIALITTPTQIYIELLGINWTINWSLVAPIGLELGILLIAIVRSAGWDTKSNTWIERGLIAMSVVINLFGSLIEVEKHLGLSDFQFWAGIVVSVLMGFCIPFLTAWTGNALVKLATGEVKFDIVDLSKKWAVEGRDYLRRELYRVALGVGASTANATKFSERVSEQYFQNIDFDDAMDNIGTVPVVPSVPNVQNSPQIAPMMGFTGMHESRMNTSVPQISGLNGQSNVQGQTGQIEDKPRLTKAKAKQWMAEYPDELKTVLDANRDRGKRDTAKAICEAMGYDSSSYKTIERILGDKL